MTRIVLDAAHPDTVALDAAPVGSRLIATYPVPGAMSVLTRYVKVDTGDPMYPTAWDDDDGLRIYYVASFAFPEADRLSLHVPALMQVAIEGDGQRGWLCHVPGCVDDHKSGLDSIDAALVDARAHLANHAELAGLQVWWPRGTTGARKVTGCVIDMWGSNLSHRVEAWCQTHGLLGVVDDKSAAAALRDAHLLEAGGSAW